MNRLTHFLLSWNVANFGNLDHRDRFLVSAAGIIPDADAFGMLPELLTRDPAQPLFWWTGYHHVLGHNLSVAALFLAFYRAWQRGYSPIGMFFRSADAVFIVTLRHRFGNPCAFC